MGNPAVRPAVRPDWWSSDEWITPPHVFADLAARYGPFNLDPCARPENAKAPQFYTAQDNGLVQSWKGRIFLNPPYSDIRPWLRKAIRAADEGHVVVALLPAATDTAWFHECVWSHAALHFLRGRVRFIGWQGTPIPSPRNPGLVAVYGLGTAKALPPPTED